MANGSHKEGPAYADRLREKYGKHLRATERAIQEERKLEPYREDMDSVSEVTLGKEGVRAKGPPWLVLALGLLIAGVVVAWLLFHR